MDINVKKMKAWKAVVMVNIMIMAMVMCISIMCVVVENIEEI